MTQEKSTLGDQILRFIVLTGLFLGMGILSILPSNMTGLSDSVRVIGGILGFGCWFWLLLATCGKVPWPKRW